MTFKSGYNYKILNQMEAQARRNLRSNLSHTTWDIWTVNGYTFTVSVTRFKGLAKPVFCFEDGMERDATVSILEATDILTEALILAANGLLAA